MDFDFNIPWPEPGDWLFRLASHQPPSSRPPFLSDRRFQWWYYADGFKEAADLLCAHVREADTSQWVLFYPASFLYRHYLELALKLLLLADGRGGNKGHDLRELWKKVRQLIEARSNGSGGENLDAVESCIKEFMALDPTGEGFRYPVTMAGQPTLGKLDSWDPQQLQATMDKIAHFLRAWVDPIWLEADARAERVEEARAEMAEQERADKDWYDAP